MALYTRKEFAMLCRTTSAVVTTNVNRGNIKLLDKKIDSDNKINRRFFNRYVKKAEAEDKAKKAKPEESIEELYDKVVKKSKNKKTTPSKEALDKSIERLKAQAEASVEHDWDLRKKKAEALLKERNAEKALLSVKKMYGEMLPTEFVTRMFSTFTKTLFSVFDNSLMNLAGVYCDELAGGDREALSRVNQKLNEEFQIIIKDATEIAKKDLTNEIKEYSVTRGKGENK